MRQKSGGRSPEGSFLAGLAYPSREFICDHARRRRTQLNPIGRWSDVEAAESTELE